MPRNGSGTYELPANTLAVTGATIDSTKFNSLVQDLEADANVDRPISAGGTGASTAAAALTNLFSGASPGGADKIAFWDNSESAFGWLSLGTGLTFNGTTLALDADLSTGLTFNGTTLALDADLSTLAGLTVAADNFIAGNSGGTAWEVKTPSQARTSLGLGTAATQNTGTSGATVPLLDAANTWSGTQTLSGAGLKWATTSTTSSDPGFHMTNSTGRLDCILNTSSGLYIGVDAGGTERTLTLSTAGVLATGGNTVWHAGNDGAGSGLDADTLDGVQGSAYATLANSQTFTGAKNFTGGLQAGGVDVVSLSATQTLTNKTLTAPLLTDQGPTSASEMGYRGAPRNRQDGNYTLVLSDAGKLIMCFGSGTITHTIPANSSVAYPIGTTIMFCAGSAATVRIAITTDQMNLAASASTGTRTLAPYGIATAIKIDTTTWIISGAGLT